MSENAITSVGTRVFILNQAPTANTAAGYAALTGWKEIGDLDNVGEFGPEDSILTRRPLATGNIEKGKGATDYGDFPLTGAFVDSDEGQIELQAARKAKGNYSFYIEYQNGAKEYMRGLMTSFRKTPGGSEDFLTFSSSVSVSQEPVYVPAPETP